MHRPQGTWIVAITVHILGEHGSARDVCFKQAVPKLIGVESLAELEHVPRVVELNVDLSPGARLPRGDAGIDPEPGGDSTGRWNSR